MDEQRKLTSSASAVNLFSVPSNPDKRTSPKLTKYSSYLPAVSASPQPPTAMVIDRMQHIIVLKRSREHDLDFQLHFDELFGRSFAHLPECSQHESCVVHSIEYSIIFKSHPRYDTAWIISVRHDSFHTGNPLSTNNPFQLASQPKPIISSAVVMTSSTSTTCESWENFIRTIEDFIEILLSFSYLCVYRSVDGLNGFTTVSNHAQHATFQQRTCFSRTTD